MIRLLGAITGSALALATLLVLIGIPQFKTQTNDVERSVVTLPLPTTAIDGPQSTPARAEPVATDAVPASTPQAADALDGTIPQDADSMLASNDATSTGDSDPPPAPTPPAEPIREDEVQAALDYEQSWYAFWSPFRSELAASGFVSRLQSVTGLDYRVVRIKPGVYEVAFAYTDDADIPQNLDRITAATGLQLPE